MLLLAVATFAQESNESPRFKVSSLNIQIVSSSSPYGSSLDAYSSFIESIDLSTSYSIDESNTFTDELVVSVLLGLNPTNRTNHTYRVGLGVSSLYSSENIHAASAFEDETFKAYDYYVYETGAAVNLDASLIINSVTDSRIGFYGGLGLDL